LFIDELVDNGLDSLGAEMTLAVLKNIVRSRNKSVWLVSHKEELIGRVTQVFKVVKEGGFTSFSSDADIT
jgi:ABC-type multidrug transport system ATPase subunit